MKNTSAQMIIVPIYLTDQNFEATKMDGQAKEHS